eukprot:SAG11_NODE_7484_length_1138_cov_0.942252_2_plen_207_part_00
MAFQQLRLPSHVPQLLVLTGLLAALRPRAPALLVEAAEQLPVRVDELDFTKIASPPTEEELTAACPAEAALCAKLPHCKPFMSKIAQLEDISQELALLSRCWVQSSAGQARGADESAKLERLRNVATDVQCNMCEFMVEDVFVSAPPFLPPLRATKRRAPRGSGTSATATMFCSDIFTTTSSAAGYARAPAARQAKGDCGAGVNSL